jgi:hypothetical protein
VGRRICSEGRETLLRPSDLEKVQEGYPGSLSEFGQSGEVGCAEAQTSEVRSSEVPEEIYTVDLRGELDR